MKTILFLIIAVSAVALFALFPSQAITTPEAEMKQDVAQERVEAESPQTPSALSVEVVPDYVLTKRKSVTVESGIIALDAGTKVDIKGVAEDGCLRVSTGDVEFVVPINEISNDPAVISAIHITERQRKIDQSKAMADKMVEMKKWEERKRAELQAARDEEYRKYVATLPKPKTSAEIEEQSRAKYVNGIYDSRIRALRQESNDLGDRMSYRNGKPTDYATARKKAIAAEINNLNAERRLEVGPKPYYQFRVIGGTNSSN